MKARRAIGARRAIEIGLISWIRTAGLPFAPSKGIEFKQMVLYTVYGHAGDGLR